LIIAGGSDVAKALALGTDAVYIATPALIALNCNKPLRIEDYHVIGAALYASHHCHTGRCPVRITAQDLELTQRLKTGAVVERVANWFHAVTAEVQILARDCGRRDVHDLEPEDLRALALEASLLTGVALAGTNVVFGGGPEAEALNGHLDFRGPQLLAGFSFSSSRKRRPLDSLYCVCIIRIWTQYSEP
jgi:hypothetical protein